MSASRALVTDDVFLAETSGVCNDENTLVLSTSYETITPQAHQVGNKLPCLKQYDPKVENKKNKSQLKNNKIMKKQKDFTDRNLYKAIEEMEQANIEQAFLKDPMDIITTNIHVKSNHLHEVTCDAKEVSHIINSSLYDSKIFSCTNKNNTSLDKFFQRIRKTTKQITIPKIKQKLQFDVYQNTDDKYKLVVKHSNFKKVFYMNDSDVIGELYSAIFINTTDGNLIYEDCKLSPLLTAGEVGFFEGINYVFAEGPTKIKGPRYLHLKQNTPNGECEVVTTHCDATVGDLVQAKNYCIIKNGILLHPSLPINDIFEDGDVFDLVSVDLLQ